MAIAVNEGVDVNSLKLALIEEDTKGFYNLIGFTTNDVEILDRIYFEAHSKLLEKFPELLTDKNFQSNEASKVNMIDNYFLRINEIKISLRSNDPDKRREVTKKEQSKRGWFDGCKKLPLAACTLGCGVATPTVVVAVICGYGCYCGFCERDRDGVCN